MPAVPRCAEAQVADGSCADASRIGTATVSAGAGSAPFTLSGPVFFTGPYAGAPFGLSVVVRVIAGPYDLGTVVVRAGIRVDPVDAHLTVDSAQLPTVVGGVPLRLRLMRIAVDRPNFLLNPTACGQLSIGSHLVSTQGTVATPASHVGVSGCERLGFTPRIDAVVSGRPTAKSGTSLKVTLTQPSGQANLKRVSVKLPKQFSARGTTVARACIDTVFLANPSRCPAASHVGGARATTPLLPDSLVGGAWLVGHNGALPTLEVLLDGSGVHFGLSSLISYGGGYSSTFGKLPDVPVDRFAIELPRGATSLLGVVGDICNRRYSMPTTYTSQDGRTRTQIVRLRIENCPVRVIRARVLRGGRALLTVRAPSAGRLTVSGRDLRRTRRSLRAAATAHVVVRLSRNGARRLALRRSVHRTLTPAATVRFVPRGSAGVARTPSRALRRFVLH